MSDLKADVSPRFLERVPREFAREHLVICAGLQDGVHRLAIAPDTPPAVVFNLRARLEQPIEAEVADPEQIARIIDEAYGQHGQELRLDENDIDVEDSRLDELLAQIDQDLLNTQGKGAVVKFVDALLFDALGKKASDLHVQPTADETLIRARVDGDLHTVHCVPHELARAVVSRIKVMGRMDIAERRIAQDGRATVTIGKKPIDLRISTFPTNYGERAVLRLLDTSRHLSDFTELGMPSNVSEPFLRQAQRSRGIVLVTGPTGSGKTTTLYSTLRGIASPRLNIMTIEDPIEYELSTEGGAISQAQVNVKKGVTFATGLRHILRQDPDVILVGEIRDAETARMAIQSSLTGHLVFATLHTNDAPSAITRLIDLGVEPFLLSASLSAVLAQRLVRLVHDPCRGSGCEECLDVGLLGRTGIFELMLVDELLSSHIAQRKSLNEIREHARAQLGMRTLREHGEELLAQGRVRAEEVERILEAGE